MNFSPGFNTVPSGMVTSVTKDAQSQSVDPEEVGVGVPVEVGVVCVDGSGEPEGVEVASVAVETVDVVSIEVGVDGSGLELGEAINVVSVTALRVSSIAISVCADSVWKVSKVSATAVPAGYPWESVGAANGAGIHAPNPKAIIPRTVRKCLTSMLSFSFIKP